MRPAARRLLVVMTSLVLAASAPAAASAQNGSSPVPEGFRHPTAQQVDKSIRVWTTKGSVTGVASTSEEDGDTVVVLRSDILFDFGSSSLSAEASATIAELAEDIPEGAAVSVTGHTDDIGTDADNLALSQARAQAVTAGLARPDLAVEAVGRGESDPATSNDDPAGRQQNRRVEIRYADR